MAYLDYDDYALAEHDRAECEADDRQAAMDALTDRVQREIERDVMACTELGDLSKGFVTAGERTLGGKVTEVAQPVVDAFLEAVIDNQRNLAILSKLIASPAGKELREAFAKTHAAINASIVAEARGL
jgi:hypothetical protein